MAENTGDEAVDEYEFLVTRAEYHQKRLKEEVSSKQHRKTKYLSKFVTCGKHKTAEKDCSECISFPVQEQLPNTRLPNGLQVLGYFFLLPKLIYRRLW